MKVKIASALLALTGSAYALNAIAVLNPIGNSTVRGTVVFSEDGKSSDGKSNYSVNVNLVGLAPNAVVGSHIHTWGDISDSEMGLLSGAHFNPTNQSHGCPIIPGVSEEFENGTVIGEPIGSQHVGDYLPSGLLAADDSGEVNITVAVPGISLDVLKEQFIIGRTLVVHAAADDCITQPTGNSGGRISQGVIGWGSEAPNASFVAEDYEKKAHNLTQAIAVLQSINSSSITGTVQLIHEALDKPVKLYIKASGAPPNTKLAWHVHQTGNISDTTAGLATGGHFNPYETSHGCFINATRHAGDLDNLQTNDKGEIEATVATDLLSLFKGSKSYAIGRAIIIHSKFDECIGSTGNAGGRLAQGVIGYRNASLTFNGDINAQVPKNQQPTASPTSGSNSLIAKGVGAFVVTLMVTLMSFA